MTDLNAVLKAEMARVARRVTRAEVTPLQKRITQQQKQIAQLRRDLIEARRRQTVSKPQAVKAPDGESKTNHRFTTKGFISLRKQLGLSMPEMADLLGTSEGSIYNWERGTTPRSLYVTRIARLRGIGKKAARRRLVAARAK